MYSRERSYRTPAGYPGGYPVQGNQPSPQQTQQNHLQQQGVNVPPAFNIQPPNQSGYHQPEQQVPANKQAPANQQTPAKQEAAVTASAAKAAESIEPTTSQSEGQFISTKIWKVNGKDKVVDFSSKLIKAYEQDFANIHGIGGSDHAANSTIGITICDFTKGKNDKSVTVKYAVDVEDMTMLYHAAMDARLGKLSSASTPSVAQPLIDVAQFARQKLRSWLQIQPYPDNSRPIPYEEIEAVGKALADGIASANSLSQPASNIAFSYSRQKNNPYSTSVVNGQEFAPVSQINVFFDPSRNYPWTIQITNFDAPISHKKNGANTHNASQAINKQEAFINLSADDFCHSMVAVDRFVRLWEQRMFRMLDRNCTKYEQALEEKRKSKRNNNRK